MLFCLYYVELDSTYLYSNWDYNVTEDSSVLLAMLASKMGIKLQKMSESDTDVCVVIVKMWRRCFL